MIWIDIASFLLTLDIPGLLFSPATIPTQELMLHDRQPMDDEDSDHLEVDQVESDEGDESMEEKECQPTEPPVLPPAYPLEDQEENKEDNEDMPEVENEKENEKEKEEEKQDIPEAELQDQMVDMEGLTQDDPPNSPLKEIEVNQPNDKCLVIEDSPNPKAESAEEVDAAIRNLQKKLAMAKRERLAKNLSASCQFIFLFCQNPKSMFNQIYSG